MPIIVLVCCIQEAQGQGIYMTYMIHRKIALNLGLVLVFTIINYILSQNDEEMNKNFFKIRSLLDSFYFTVLSHITSFFKYNSSSIKLTNIKHA